MPAREPAYDHFPSTEWTWLATRVTDAPRDGTVAAELRARVMERYAEPLRIYAKGSSLERHFLDGVTYEEAARELCMRTESTRPAARLAQAKVRDWMRWLLALESVSEPEMDDALADIQRLGGP